MLQLVDVGKKSIADYASLASRGVMDEIRRLAEPLAGKRVVHLSATAFGGGVAEINYALVPADEGRRARRRVADHQGRRRVLRRHEGDPQRAPGRPARPDDRAGGHLPPLQRDERRGVRGRVRLRDRPRPAARGVASTTFRSRRASWIWRCHIDLSAPNRAVLDFLAPSLERYDAAIFHMPRVRAAARRAARGLHLAARDRPADAEEHGALAPRTRRTSSTSSGSTSSARC